MKNVVMSPKNKMNKNSVVWTVGDEWDSWDGPEVEVKCLVTTSSWQQIALSNIKAKYYDIIKPAVPDFSDEYADARPYNGVLNVIWAGNTLDGTLMMLGAILTALNIRVKLDIHATNDVTEDTLTFAYIKDINHSVTKYDTETFKKALLDAHVYATPTMGVKSCDTYAQMAMAAGCLVVAPKHSGYHEIFNHFGFLCIHSVDNSLYASSFGAKLLDAQSLYSNPKINAYIRAQTGFCAAWGSDVQALNWKELEELMSLKDS